MPKFMEIVRRNLAVQRARTRPGAAVARDAKIAAIRAVEAAKVAEAGAAKVAAKETPERAAVAQEAAAQARDAAETASAQAEQAEFAAAQGAPVVAIAAEREAKVAAEQAVVAAAAAGIGEKPTTGKPKKPKPAPGLPPYAYLPAGTIRMKRGTPPEMPPGPGAVPAPAPVAPKVSTNHMFYGRPVDISAIMREQAKSRMIIQGVVRDVYDPNRKAIRVASVDEF